MQVRGSPYLQIGISARIGSPSVRLFLTSQVYYNQEKVTLSIDFYSSSFPPEGEGLLLEVSTQHPSEDDENPIFLMS